MTTTRLPPVTESEISHARDSVRSAVVAAQLAAVHAAESASRIRAARGGK